MTMEIEAVDIKLNEEKRKDDSNNKIVQNDVKPNLKGDILNVILLTILCMLQGIPLGISMAVKTYMQNMKVSYVEQAKFGIVDLPYSLKLLWAPMVDAAYYRRMGKRKSWLVPSQLCIGLTWLLLGSNLSGWITKDGSHMTVLTCVFFCINFMAATQDIAGDGWAITMLRRENVGYASTCNTTGHTLGITFGYVFFILFESEEFCNKWLRFTNKKGGIITMQGYLHFWGITYIVASAVLGFWIRETCSQSDKGSRINVTQTYKLLWKILKLKTIKAFIIVMLTYEIAFSSLGSTVSNPKFMEYGVAKENIALVDMSLIPVKIISSLVVSKYTAGPKSLEIFYKSVPIRLFLGIFTSILIYYTPYFINDETQNRSTYFFVIYELYRIVKLVLSVVMYLGVQAFFSRISDPRIGGTYMSLLNTVWYFGMTTARIVALALLNQMTLKRCSADETNACRSQSEIEACQQDAAGECSVIVDGYHVEMCICTAIGVTWYVMLRNTLMRLQCSPVAEWQVNNDGGGGGGRYDDNDADNGVTVISGGGGGGGYDNDAYDDVTVINIGGGSVGGGSLRRRQSSEPNSTDPNLAISIPTPPPHPSPKPLRFPRPHLPLAISSPTSTQKA